MRPRKLASIALIASIAFLGTFAPARATDFTIVVPVDFNNLPSDAKDFVVQCSVYAPSGEIGYGATYPNVAITAGAYHGDVTITINPVPGIDLATGNQYRCKVAFASRADYRIVYFQTPSSPTFPLRSGASFVIDTGLQPIPH